MSIVSATGLGTGIDINNLVTQLVTAEGQPAFNAIKRQQAAANTQLSGNFEKRFVGFSIGDCQTQRRRRLRCL